MSILANKKILVVEDDPFSQEVMMDYLESVGCTVKLAIDGKRAVQLFAGFEPDLVLLDINIPGVNGIECLKQIMLKKPDARVIMTTGESSFKIARECVDLGAYTHLVKPIDIDHLGKVIGQALGLEEEGRGFETNIDR
ncbi:MAG: two-component system response regulator [Nitrospinae bacterium CG11_big_fil_rev_8_21_14_0_20_56_8]|nr:MAG: two-component system response regulator [Nitrospinae bacterium CG11_big_fil_rev_8_21_14_0_20_56_8]